MATVLYPSPIFGPVHSRRLGISLGINLAPADGKICTFDCIYCECGFNAEHRPRLKRPSRKDVAAGLEEKLKEMAAEGIKPDVLTFAGNGEPTTHPQFAEIIDDTLELRDKYCTNAKISVLSNSTMIYRDDVRKALMRIDNNILKLDTVCAEYINMVDRPQAGCYNIDSIIEELRNFNGNAIIQTMFMKGTAGGKSVDNTGNEYVEPWLKALKYINPKGVMVYTIDRETPEKGLRKATKDELDNIRDRVIAMGIACTASY